MTEGKKRLSSSGRASRHHLGLSTTCVMHYMGFLRFRPLQEVQERRAGFRYATWSIPLPPSVARAACTGLLTVGVVKTYRFRLSERGSYKGFDFATSIGGDS